MIATTLGRGLPAQALRRWRSLRFRTRATLALLATALLIGAWLGLHDPDDDWPARVVMKIERGTYLLGFSPDGRTFLTSTAGSITPRDAATGRKGTTWAIGGGVHVTSGAYSPDGRTFAAATVRAPQGLAIELMDTSTGRSRATLRTHHPSLYSLAFDADGRSLRAFLGDGPTLREMATWDASTGLETRRHAITAPTNTNGCWMASTDGQTLALMPDRSRTVQLWDVEADRPLGGLTNPAWSGMLGVGLGFSADGRTLAVTREDGAIDLWDVPNRTLRKTLPGHSGGYGSMGLRFAPDGRTLASVGGDNGRRSALGQLRDDIERKLFGSASSPDPEVIVVDLATGKRLARAVSSMFPIYSPDGRTVTTLREDLGVRLRDVPDLPR